MSTGDGARDEDRPALATLWGAYRKWTMLLAGLAVLFVVLDGLRPDLRWSAERRFGVARDIAEGDGVLDTAVRVRQLVAYRVFVIVGHADRSGGNADRGERDGVRTRRDIGRRQPGDGLAGAPRRRGVGQLVVCDG